MNSVTNPFPRPLPVIVLLRNKELALIEQLVEDCPPFHLLGAVGLRQEPLCAVGARCERLPDLHLWRLDGRWRDNGQSHPLDIVGYATSQEGNLLSMQPFAPAAGGKGPQP